MAIHYEILGRPGQDNALLVRVDSGQGVKRLLFDCGEGCLDGVSFSELQLLDQVFFSHFHIDHVAGFDALFRAVFNRHEPANHLWGPPGSAEILQHRFRGFLWNLADQMSGTWRVHEVHPGATATSRFELHEAFAVRHDEGTAPCDAARLDLGPCTIEAWVMNHGTPSLAWIVREKSRSNVDVSRLAGLGLRPGPWLKQLTTATGAQLEQKIEAGSQSLTLAQLRAHLLVETPGASIAYLTDFLLDDAARDLLIPALKGVTTLVCEAQYRASDWELSRRNFHMTTQRTAELARDAEVGDLVLFHLSSRYTPENWGEMLAEARAVFPRTSFPNSWKLST
ncbi:MAG: MBL fold metallo-hydrolase [Planctomycetaceae bacterium]